MRRKGSQPAERRSFIKGLGLGVGAAGSALAGVPAAAQSTESGRWQPARHEQDDWLDGVPGKHRVVFDTTTNEGMASAILYATNYFNVNRSNYGLQDGDLAVVIVARHKSTAFAYNDVMWAKYGAQLSNQTGYTDPNTTQAPLVNPYATSGGSGQQPGRLQALLKRGVHLAVCQLATRAIAGSIARASGSDTDAIFNELAANLVSNSHLAPAGIVAVNRAQERGYSFVLAV